jgi:hypothetical protein
VAVPGRPAVVALEQHASLAAGGDGLDGAGGALIETEQGGRHLAKGCEAAEAARTPVAVSAEPQRAARARSARELTQRR